MPNITLPALDGWHLQQDDKEKGKKPEGEGETAFALMILLGKGLLGGNQNLPF